MSDHPIGGRPFTAGSRGDVSLRGGTVEVGGKPVLQHQLDAARRALAAGRKRRADREAAA